MSWRSPGTEAKTSSSIFGSFRRGSASSFCCSCSSDVPVCAMFYRKNSSDGGCVTTSSSDMESRQEEKEEVVEEEQRETERKMEVEREKETEKEGEEQNSANESGAEKCEGESDDPDSGSENVVDAAAPSTATSQPKQRAENKCKECNRVFRRKRDFVSHMARHSGLKPFECKQCGLSFARRDSLRVHNCPGSKDLFHCEVCGRSYTHRGYLLMHLNNAHSDRRLTCPVCARTFVLNSHLLSHKCFHVREVQGGEGGERSQGGEGGERIRGGEVGESQGSESDERSQGAEELGETSEGLGGKRGERREKAEGDEEASEGDEEPGRNEQKEEKTKQKKKDMDLLWTLVFLLLLSPCESRPPETTSVSPPEQVSPTAPSSDQSRFHRLPGLCRRLKRRRITVMCNLEKFCWPPLSQDQGQDQDQDQDQSQGRTGTRPGQVCRCPRGLRCSHYFIHSL